MAAFTKFFNALTKLLASPAERSAAELFSSLETILYGYNFSNSWLRLCIVASCKGREYWIVLQYSPLYVYERRSLK